MVPPVACDAALCISAASQPVDYVAGLLGTYRLLLSDVLVLTQCEPPFADDARVPRARRRRRGRAARACVVVPTVFRPRPAQPVRGRRVAFFTTAPEGAVPRLARALADDHGAEVVLVSAALADRARLAPDVARAAREADVFLCEIKAAAVDVVAEAADGRRPRARVLRQRARGPRRRPRRGRRRRGALSRRSASPSAARPPRDPGGPS